MRDHRKRRLTALLVLVSLSAVVALPGVTTGLTNPAKAAAAEKPAAAGAPAPEGKAGQAAEQDQQAAQPQKPSLAVSLAALLQGRGQPSWDPDYSALKKQLEKYVADSGIFYGIYFKDLESGKSFGINEYNWIEAASTNKVPTVLLINRLATEGKVFWTDRVPYQSWTDYQGGAGILQAAAQDGDTYSLRTLTNLAITLSDNVALRMLNRWVGLDTVVQFMKDLGSTTAYPYGRNITTARDMGLYMQAVYAFAKEHPEEGGRLLDDLANTIYHVGLPGKLPRRVTVAHKEGWIWGVANDVGIVFDQHPYVLVVMSKGITDEHQAFGKIAEISRMVYDYQQAQAR